jgi:hypothetical protein
MFKLLPDPVVPYILGIAAAWTSTSTVERLLVPAPRRLDDDLPRREGTM